MDQEFTDLICASENQICLARRLSCISFRENALPLKQQDVYSHSFGQQIAIYDELRQAICQYAEQAAEKLRGKRQYCRSISFFIPPPFRQCAVLRECSNREAKYTNASPPLDTIAAVVNALDKIWVSGHRYAKAGIMLNEFSPNGVSQLNLFDKIQRGHTVMS